MKIYGASPVTETNIILKPLKGKNKMKIYGAGPVTESNIILKPLKGRTRRKYSEQVQ